MAAVLIFCAAVFTAFHTRAQAQALEKTTEMVLMRDGVRLATDIYRPKGKVRVPALLIRTPYGRESMATPLLPFLGGKGIALVVQDTRGRHDSEGISSIFLDDPIDGYETVEWLAAQPWCNGKVGTAGISAMGITQYVMHKQPPPHLTCQNVMAAPESIYHTIVYQGGAVRRALFYGWVLGLDYPMQVMQLILAQVDYNDLWGLMDISDDYDNVNVPIMHMAGWYDLYLPGNLNAFMGIQEQGGPNAKGKQRLVIGPWTHGGFLSLRGTNQGDLEYPTNSAYDISKVIGWFQECLHGKDKGFMSGPTVRYYVMGDPEDPNAPGNEWRTADTWPVPAMLTPYYLHADGGLSTTAPASVDSGLTITDDPFNPVPTLGSRAHAEQRHPVDLRPIEERDDVLVFTTPPLEKPMEITGDITAVLYFTTDVVDTDFAVRVSDVYPDGRSMQVTDGIARASHRVSDRYRVPITPGEPVEMKVDVWPTSIIFNKGHSIRIVISATNFPRFDINHHNGLYHHVNVEEFIEAKKTNLQEYVYTPNPAPGAVPAHTTLYLNKDMPSHIILPVAGMD